MMAQDGFDLARCLEEARRGGEEAARTLVERLHPLVIRIVRSHLPKRAAEEDLAQEVFVKMFSRLTSYESRDGIPFEHWLSRLAVRTCLDALRAESRRPETRWSDLSEEHSAWLEFMLADEKPAPDATASSAREIIEKLLSQLPPDDRFVLSLLDLEGKSVKEISAIAGWSATLVKVRAFRARKKLRKLAEAMRQEYRHEEF